MISFSDKFAIFTNTFAVGALYNEHSEHRLLFFFFVFYCKELMKIIFQLIIRIFPFPGLVNRSCPYLAIQPLVSCNAAQFGAHHFMSHE